MSGKEKSTDPGLSAAERKELRDREAQEAIAEHEDALGEVREVSDETLISLPDFGKGSLSDLREKLGLPSTDGVRPVSKKPA